MIKTAYVDMSKEPRTYQTQIERLKETGHYGSVADPYWNRKTKRHDCCGSPRAYYHRQGCKACKEI